MEDDELVKRVSYKEIPPRVEYSLTKAAQDLGLLFQEVDSWARKHFI